MASSESVRLTLERTQSSPSAVTSTATEVPSGPLSGPSDTTWRRQRLLHIGSLPTLAPTPEQQTRDPVETTPIVPHSPTIQKSHPSYGTLPHFKQKRPGFRVRHGLPPLPDLRLPSHDTHSVSNSPTRLYGTLDRSSIFRTQRPISAYDAILPPLEGRLHDAIKDSTRLYRLRRHKSVRGRMRIASDRLMGWIIVTIVGFLTAITAFIIVRSEQWLFDIKYGYCKAGWWRARRFCCPSASETRTFALGSSPEACKTWVTWGEAFTDTGSSPLSRLLVDRTTYSLLAVRQSRFSLSSRRVLVILVASSRPSLLGPHPLFDRVNVLRHAERLRSALSRLCHTGRGLGH